MKGGHEDVNTIANTDVSFTSPHQSHHLTVDVPHVRKVPPPVPVHTHPSLFPSHARPQTALVLENPVHRMSTQPFALVDESGRLNSLHKAPDVILPTTRATSDLANTLTTSKLFPINERTESSTAFDTVRNTRGIIGDKNTRGESIAEATTMNASSPNNNNHASPSTPRKLHGTEHKAIVGSSRKTACRTPTDADSELASPTHVPNDYPVGDWESYNGYSVKGPQPSFNRPRLDYRHLPTFNFGTPLKKKNTTTASPTENKNAKAEAEAEHDVELTTSDSQGSADYAETVTPDKAVDSEQVPPHLRSPPKKKVSSSLKDHEDTKKTVKKDELQGYVPPHLRPPNLTPPAAQPQSQGSANARVDPEEVSSRPSKASMLKDITNTPHPPKTAQTKTGNRTKAQTTPYKDSPLSTVSNATSTISNVSGTTPLLSKGKGKALELEAPIAGWNGQKPRGPPKWSNEALYDMYDNSDKRQRHHMQRWLAQTVDEAVGNPVQVDVQDDGFKTGDALIDGREKLGGPLDPELHKTYPTIDPYTISKKGRTAEVAAEEYRKEIKNKVVESKEERKMLRQARKDHEAEILANMPPNPHKPKANIYIRPAEDRDMAQITTIYNWYIQNRVVASERNALNVAQWRARWNGVKDERYAFLVAVQMHGKDIDRVRRPNDEVVVGFAYAEDMSDRDNSYRLSCELQFWVDQNHKGTGIGKTLVDRMLEALDPEYAGRHGTPFVGGEDKIYYQSGGRRIIRKVLILIPYPADDEYDLKWMRKWLIRFGFYYICTLPVIGYKLGRE